MKSSKIVTIAVLVALSTASMQGCNTAVGKLFDKDDVKKPDYIATIDVYDPMKDTDIPVTIEISSDDSTEVKAAVKDIQNKDFSLAMEKINAVVAVDPKDEKAQWIKGLLHEHKGEWAPAIEAFKLSNIAKSTAMAQDGRQRCQTKKDMSR